MSAHTPHRAEELRIHALGAAISLRDWHGVERAHAAIRDAFHARSSEPVAWVIPGSAIPTVYGFIDAMLWTEGEFTRPLYAHPGSTSGNPKDGEA